jgi:hypothetical protein
MLLSFLQLRLPALFLAATLFGARTSKGDVGNPALPGRVFL